MNYKTSTGSRERRVNTTFRNLLFGGASVAAVAALISPAFAQDSQMLETVTVTARRAAMESAQKIKENSDQVVDAIVADDAGKLPDNSITEVLQRVSGVTITRFAAPSDPDHYSIEGSGVAVRGLTQVNSTLNGRQDFSANGGRALLWQDVPPELMQAVMVYKSSTADQIEGGIGGSVDLRTHMPFDRDGQIFNGSISENYGDFVKKGLPGGSALYSNTWETGIGKVGFLVDLAYSNIASRFDTYQMEPYYQHTLTTSGSATGAVNAYLPGGFDWRIGGFQRKRIGAYEALQWQPIEGLTVYQTFFQSYYDQKSQGIASYNAQDGNTGVTPSSTYVLDGSSHVVQANSEIQVGGWMPYPCYNTTAPSCSSMNNDVSASKGGNRTTDFTEGFDWRPSDKLVVSGTFQYVHGTGNVSNMDIDTMSNISSFAYDTRGSLPSVVLGASDIAQIANPADSIWWYTMDHIENHTGSQIGGNLDAKYTVSGVPVLRAIRFGLRYSNMTEKDLSSDYHWSALTPPWGSPWKYLNTANPGDTMLVTWKDFFHGDTVAPPPTIMPSFSLVNQYNNSLYHQIYGDPGDTTTNVSYLPSNYTLGNTKTKSVYLMADFGVENVFGMMVDGNIGVRVVNNSNTSFGTERQPYISGTIYLDSNPVPFTGLNATDAPSSGGYHYTKVLPSFNIQIMPTDNTHLRFAASQTLTNPSFSQLSASGGYGINICAGNHIYSTQAAYYANGCGPVGSTITSGGWGGNPQLKPQVSNNLDLSFEWYGSNQSAAHVAAFYKNINNYLEYSAGFTNKPLSLPGGSIVTLPVEMNIAYNMSSPAVVRGFEAGFTKFFDFLPSPFDGIGVDANFTYIDSRNPSALSCLVIPSSDPNLTTNCNGNIKITGLPVEGLSKYNYNLTLMYEKGDWSVRLAYGWRSSYLLVSSGANGTKTLPVFASASGQLDFGTEYKLNDNIKFGLDGQNVLGTINKTVMGVKYDRADPAIGNQQYGRNYFVSDRRFIASIKFGF